MGRLREEAETTVRFVAAPVHPGRFVEVTLVVSGPSSIGNPYEFVTLTVSERAAPG